jgi:hypothetical protein
VFLTGLIKINLSKLTQKILATVIILTVAFFLSDYQTLETANDNKPLFTQQQTGKIITVDATVIKLLADDVTGSRHQKMILKVAGKTLLLAHNIDIAPRIPVTVGAKINVRGQYEWNEKGGLIHWTHRDKKNKHTHGWVEFNNKRYQ